MTNLLEYVLQIVEEFPDGTTKPTHVLAIFNTLELAQKICQKHHPKELLSWQYNDMKWQGFLGGKCLYHIQAQNAPIVWIDRELHPDRGSWFVVYRLEKGKFVEGWIQDDPILALHPYPETIMDNRYEYFGVNSSRDDAQKSLEFTKEYYK
jgi:hypothetical protein